MSDSALIWMSGVSLLVCVRYARTSTLGHVVDVVCSKHPLGWRSRLSIPLTACARNAGYASTKSWFDPATACAGNWNEWSAADPAANTPDDVSVKSLPSGSTCTVRATRSEERRVGKEGRDRG